MEIERALIIDEPWVELILSGEKTWEMRSRVTHIRGRIGLIRKGSGLIVGEADLVDSKEIKNRRILMQTSFKHGIIYADNPELMKYNHAWVLENVRRYDKPIKYKHPQGAVIWVKV